MKKKMYGNLREPGSFMMPTLSNVHARLSQSPRSPKRGKATKKQESRNQATGTSLMINCPSEISYYSVTNVIPGATRRKLSAARNSVALDKTNAGE